MLNDQLAQTLGSSKAVTVLNLVADARVAFQELLNAFGSTAKPLVKCGHLILQLQAAKMTMAQIATETGIPKRTAELCAQFARSGIDAATVAEIGVRGTIKLLAKPRTTPNANAEPMHNEPPPREPPQSKGMDALDFLQAERAREIPDWQIPSKVLELWRRAAHPVKAQMLDMIAGEVISFVRTARAG